MSTAANCEPQRTTGTGFSPWLAIALALIVCGCALLGGNALASALLVMPSSVDVTTAIARRTVFYLFLFAPLYTFALIANRAFDQPPAVSRRSSSLVIGLFVGSSTGAAAFALALALAFFAGVVRPGTVTASANIAGILFATILTVWQAGAEECLFRGWLQPLLTRAWGAFPGITVTGLAFAAAHLFLQLPSGLAIFNTFLAGCVFGAIAYLTGRVSSAIAAHATWNWLEQSVTGLTPNPGVDALTSFFDLDLAGPKLIAGAEDGLTGSVATTLILAVVFAGLSAAIYGREARNH